MASLNPSPDRVREFSLQAEDDTPIVMINLLKYREHADYPAGMQAEPCSGRDAYQRYAAVALTKVNEVGGRPVWMGAVKGVLIGPNDERWDDAVLVEYPSRAAFLRMISQPEYQAVAPHRTAALEDSRLIVTAPQAG